MHHHVNLYTQHSVKIQGKTNFIKQLIGDNNTKDNQHFYDMRTISSFLIQLFKNINS